MGLLDVLNGMQNGPRGEPAPGQGGMSKTAMALLAFLAYKAYKSMISSQAAPAGAPSRDPQDEREPGGLAGAHLRTYSAAVQCLAQYCVAALTTPCATLRNSGHGDVARSWVSRGPNKRISPEELELTLGERGTRDLMQQTGMEREELLDALAEHLPRVIDHLTPDGRVPTDQTRLDGLNISIHRTAQPRRVARGHHAAATAG